MQTISYSNITTFPGHVNDSRFCGSSRWRHIGDKLVARENSSRPFEITGNIYSDYLLTIKYCQYLGLPLSAEALKKSSTNVANYSAYITRYRSIRDAFDKKKTVQKKAYKLNKSKVRKRIIALCRLKQSYKFLAFYSISFPANAPDDVIYEIYNKWLTTCRQHHGLTTYVWVAERQKNGTLHFHILTNNYLEIHKVNKAMAKCINTSVLQGKLSWGQSSLTLYNGVDVDSIQHTKRRQGETRAQYRWRLKEQKKHTIKERVKFATRYMTKYMSKNDEVFTHLPFHCSRDISQLFTSLLLSDKDFEKYKQYLSDNPEDYIIYKDEERTTFVFKTAPPDIIFSVLDKLNNMLYDMYHNNNSS